MPSDRRQRDPKDSCTVPRDCAYVCAPQLHLHATGSVVEFRTDWTDEIFDGRQAAVPMYETTIHARRRPPGAAAAGDDDSASDKYRLRFKSLIR